MRIQLPELPFEFHELEPFLSRETVERHYTKHQQEHVNRLNRAVQNTTMASMSLHDLVLCSEGEIFYEAAQAWNHYFYWKCLSPKKNTEVAHDLLVDIERDFGSFGDFKIEFQRYGLRHPGAGWVWLVKLANGELKVINTENADTPILDVNSSPLFAVDVWEHAYYGDYEHRRAAYLENIWEFVNWHFVNSNYMNV